MHANQIGGVFRDGYVPSAMRYCREDHVTNEFKSFLKNELRRMPLTFIRLRRFHYYGRNAGLDNETIRACISSK